MNNLLRALVTASLLVVTGCTTAQIVPAAELTANVYLLDVEFEEVHSKFAVLPLSESERSLVDQGFAIVDKVLENYTGASASQLLIEVITARETLDTVAGGFAVVEIGYLSYLDRTGDPADPFIKAFGESANSVYDTIVEHLRELDASEYVTADIIGQYVGIVLRIAAAAAL